MIEPGWNSLLPVRLSYSDTYDTKRMVRAEMGGTGFVGTGESIVEALEMLVCELRASHARNGTDRIIKAQEASKFA